MAIKFNLPQLTTQQKQALALGIAMFSAGAYFYAKHIWIPWSQKIDTNYHELQKVQDQIQAAQQEAKHLEVLERELTALNVRALDAEKRLPKTRDLPAVFD